jgi:hypothetical protein
LFAQTNFGKRKAVVAEAALVPEKRVELRELNTEQFDSLCTIANGHSSGVTALCPAQIGDRFVLYSGGHDARIKVKQKGVSLVE